MEIKIGGQTRFENLLKQLFHLPLLDMTEVIITNSRYALDGCFITSYPTRAHGIIVIYNYRHVPEARRYMVWKEIKVSSINVYTGSIANRSLTIKPRIIQLSTRGSQSNFSIVFIFR